MPRDPIGLAYGAAAVVFCCLAVVTWRRRARNPTIAVSLTLVMAGAGWWSVSLTVAMSTTDETVAAIARLATFPGASFMVAAFVCLGLAIAVPRWVPSRRLVLGLLIEPALITVVAATNPAHLWLYGGPGATRLTGSAAWSYGPGFWLDTAYGYLGMGVGLALVARGWWKAPPAFRRQRLVMLLAALFPLVVNSVFLAGGFGDLADPTLLACAVTGTLMSYAIFRQDLFAFTPVARALIVDQIGDAIVVVSPVGRVLDLNPAGVGLVRAANPDAPPDLVGMSAQDLFASVKQIASDSDGRWTEISVEFATGRAEFHVRSFPLIDRHGRALGNVYVARNVTEANDQTRRLSEANAQLVRQVETIERLRTDLVELASRDSLTGLHNRRHLVDHFGSMIQAAERSGEPVAVVLIDVDRFKSINDGYGHLAGDQVLVGLARQMREQAPAGALVARWGGEEFFIALPGAAGGAALAFAEELRYRCERRGLTVAADTIRCTVSIGVAVFPTSGTTVNEIFHAADVALYEAKDCGRNRVRLHENLLPAPRVELSGR